MTKKKIILKAESTIVTTNSYTSDEQVIQALKVTNGNVLESAKLLGITSIPSFRHRLKRNLVLQDALIEAKESILDKAENVILNAIEKGDLEAAKWFLRYQGKTRGYGETLTVGGKVEVQHTNYQLANLSEEELDELERISNRITIDVTPTEGN